MRTFSKQLLAGAALAAGLVLGGCANERHDAVPPTARLVSQGDDKLVFTAERDGDVWVDSKGSDKLFYSGKIAKGQTLAVEPEKDRITLDGRTVIDKDIDDGRTYRVHFRPEKDETVTVRKRTTETRIERDND